MNKNNNILNQLPMGFSMNLAQNIDALNKFSNLSQPKRQTIINKAKRISTKAEMISLINSIENN